VTRSAAGIYKVVFDDAFYKLLTSHVEFRSGVTSTDVAGGGFSPGTVYQITALGSTTNAQWVTAGAPTGAAVGTVFLAAGVGAGSGTVKALAQSGIARVDVVSQDADTRLRAGQHVIFECFDFNGALADPVAASTMHLMFMFRDSSSIAKGE
jgi:hypothetical protein